MFALCSIVFSKVAGYQLLPKYNWNWCPRGFRVKFRLKPSVIWDPDSGWQTYFGDFMMTTVLTWWLRLKMTMTVLRCWWQNYYVVVLTNLPIGDYFDSSFFQFTSTFLISTRSYKRSKNDKTPNETNLTRTHWSVHNRIGHWPVIPGLCKFQFCHGRQ